MKKICFLFNSLSDSNGVSRSVIAISNLISKHRNVQVTLIPIYNCCQQTLNSIDERVIVKPLFGFYFRGFSVFCNRIPKIIYSKYLRLNNYNIVVAFQYGLATQIVANMDIGNTTQKLIWMHTYDYKHVLWNCYKKIGHVVCVSKCNQKKLLEEMNNRIKVDYCYNPINDLEIVKEGNQPISLQRESSLLFVTVGRHSAEKGYIRLLNIVAKLKKDSYKFTLWLIGDGPQHDELIKKADELQINDIVVFIGAKSNPHAYTSKADVFICSSYREGYSTACTEAIMLGIPVITTNCSGGEEIVEEAECGLLTEMDDNSLYTGIKYVLDNPSVIDEWKQILQNSKNKFSQKVRAQHLFQILDL